MNKLIHNQINIDFVEHRSEQKKTTSQIPSEFIHAGLIYSTCTVNGFGLCLLTRHLLSCDARVKWTIYCKNKNTGYLQKYLVE